MSEWVTKVDLELLGKLKQCDVYSYVHLCSVHPGSQAVDFSKSESSIFESTTDTTLKFCVSRNIIMMKPQYQEQKKSHHWLQGPIHFIMFFLCNLKLFSHRRPMTPQVSHTTAPSSGVACFSRTWKINIWRKRHFQNQICCQFCETYCEIVCLM